LRKNSNKEAPASNKLSELLANRLNHSSIGMKYLPMEPNRNATHY